MSTSDITRCHDDLCVNAELCWRYVYRTNTKWGSHALTLRETQDLTGERCTHFIPAEDAEHDASPCRRIHAPMP